MKFKRSINKFFDGLRNKTKTGAPTFDIFLQKNSNKTVVEL